MPPTLKLFARLHFILKNVHDIIVIKVAVFLNNNISTPRLPPQYESIGSHLTIHDVADLKLCSCQPMHKVHQDPSLAKVPMKVRRSLMHE